MVAQDISAEYIQINEDYIVTHYKKAMLLERIVKTDKIVAPVGLRERVSAALQAIRDYNFWERRKYETILSSAIIAGHVAPDENGNYFYTKEGKRLMDNIKRLAG